MSMLEMNYQVTFNVNSKIYLRDPESSELGKQMIKKGIDLIYSLGFEHFTIKKLAIEINTTEATIYRYFENKHKLLLYILNWYWSYLAYIVLFQLQNIPDAKTKLKTIIKLLTNELPTSNGSLAYNKKYLHHIVIAESSKAYLIKEVSEVNKDDVYKPYKDLCGTIAQIITQYNPKYKYPRSLCSTIIETAHQQQFFSSYLPRLTDKASKQTDNYAEDFLNDFLFKILS